MICGSGLAIQQSCLFGPSEIGFTFHGINMFGPGEIAENWASHGINLFGLSGFSGFFGYIDDLVFDWNRAPLYGTGIECFALEVRLRLEYSGLL